MTNRASRDSVPEAVGHRASRDSAPETNLARAVAVVARGRTAEEDLTTLLELATSAVGASQGSVFVWDAERGGLALAASTGFPAGSEMAHEADVAGNPEHPIARAAHGQTPVLDAAGVGSDGAPSVHTAWPLRVAHDGVEMPIGALGVSRAGAPGANRAGALGVNRSGALGVSRAGALGVNRSGAPGVSRAGAPGANRSGALDVDMAAAWTVSEADATLLSAFADLIAITVDRARLTGLTNEQTDWAERVAHTDALTGLANARTLSRVLELEVARAIRQGTDLSVVLFDIDGLAAANDAAGPAAGDDILREVAAVLAETVRLVDTIARWGGDEFILVAPGSAGAVVAQRVLDAVAGRLQINGRALSVSAGVARFPSDGASPDELVAAAETALRTAKATGPGALAVAGAG